MPRRDDRDPHASAAPGPYEAQYQVLRGYDAPPPSRSRTPDRGPVLVAGGRDAPRLA